MSVGILALQGDFSKHQQMARALGKETVLVRTPEDLFKCRCLIIPGGESTAIYNRLIFIGLLEPLVKFAEEHPIFGTCAGVILMGKKIIPESTIVPLGILDIAVERNAFGRQIESFSTELEISLPNQRGAKASAFFIRAPKIRETCAEVQILATFKGEAVLVQQGHHLGATFHPELTQDGSVHRYFFSLVKNV